MTAYTWVGGTSTSWGTTTNWSPNGTPGSGDTVTIPGTGITNWPTTNNTSVTVSGLTINSGGQLTINRTSSTRTLTVSTTFVNNGTITLTSSSGTSTAGLTFSGAGGCTNAGTITATAGATALSGGTGGLTNTGTISVTSGTLTVTNGLTDSGAGASISISSGATLSIASGVTMSGGTLTGAGTVTGAVTGSGTLSGTLTISGAVTASGATLDVQGYTSVGSFAIGTTAGSTLKFDCTKTIASFTMSNANQTLEVGSSGALSVSSAGWSITGGTIQLDGGSFNFSGANTLTLNATATTLQGSGSLGSNTTVAGSGAIKANVSGGTLTINGRLNGTQAITIGAATGSAAALNLVYSGANAATSASFTGTGGTLQVSGAAGALTLTSGLTLATGDTLNLSGSTSTFTDTAGITMSGGSLTGAGTLASTTAITGFGTVSAPLTGGTGLITASGNGTGTTLDLQGAVSGHTLAIGTTNASVLKLDGTVSAASFTMSSSNQTLEVGSSGALTVSSAGWSITGGTIQLDGGSFNFSASNTLTLNAAAATLQGSGSLGSNAKVAGSGAILANVSGGTLTLNAALSGTTAITIGAASGSAAALNLAYNGANAATSASFTGTGGTLQVTGASNALTLSSALTLATGNSLNLATTGSTFTDGAGITMTGGSLIGVGTVTAANTITGYGKVSVSLSSHTGAITANGGGSNTLEITQAFTGVSALAVGDGTTSGTLQIDGAGSSAAGVTFGTDGGTLDIASGGSFSMTGSANLLLGGNTLNLAGSGTQLTLVSGDGVQMTGGSITGTGQIAADNYIYGYGTVYIPVSGQTTIIATGSGTLELVQAFTGVGTLNVGHASIAGTLQVDGAASTATAVSYASGSGGDLVVKSGGGLTVADAFTLASGDTLTVNGTFTDNAGVSLASGTIQGSGSLDPGTGISGYGLVSMAFNGANTVNASGGTLFFSAAVDQTGAPTTFEIQSVSTLQFEDLVGATGSMPTVTFEGATGGVLADTAAAGTEQFGTINDFAGSNEILLTAFDSGDTLTYVGNTATISNGAGSETLTFADGTAMGNLQLADSGGVDTLTICFMAGTMIRTPGGEVAVETLQPGDPVMTIEGVARPVNWVGRQTVAARFADPLRSWPIRIRAGALDDNVPSRDLLISPDHALLVQGILVQAGALVNGTSITREPTVPSVFVYYHVEVDEHSLILAEGAPAETFVDNIDRLNFDNWAEFEALYPDGKEVEELPYPRAKARRQVPVYVRIFLAERAQIIGAAADDAAVA